MNLKKIIRPVLLLDKKKAVRNIFRMVSKARKANVSFRPHFKTHQSAEIGEWYKEFGVNKITVSSVSMAEYFAAHGWKDITIAFPANILEIDAINRLASQIKINLLFESADSVDRFNTKMNHNAGAFLKIDTGYHRTGVPHDDYSRITEIVSAIEISSRLELKGFLTHAGHTYAAKNKDEILSIHRETVERMFALKEKFSAGDRKMAISIGDTPSCSISEDFGAVDEIRPGNFVFYDVMQYALGSCKTENIAVALAVPIVAIHPERNEIIVYGGGVHLSKENIELYENNIFGLPVDLSDSGWNEPWEDSFVSKLSQEHGTIKVPAEKLNSLKVGDIIGILPVHSCLTASCMGEYVTLEGTKLELLKG